MNKLILVLSLVTRFVEAIILSNVRHKTLPPPIHFNFTVSKGKCNSGAKQIWARRRSDIAKRNGFSEVLLNHKDTSYNLDVYLGSNRQKNTVMLDTGSSDFWVSRDTYDPSTSSTAVDTGEPFFIEYIDGSRSEGEFFSDTLRFESGHLELPKFQFARAETDSKAENIGILGVADKNQESSEMTYNNLPWALKKAGLISSASYSLFLGEDGKSGSIIFGGIDKEKFHGDLSKFSIDTESGGLAVNIDSISIGNDKVSVNSPYILDSGTSLGLAGREVMEKFDAIFDTKVDTDGGIDYRLVSCDQPSDKHVDFDFGGKTISIPFSDLILHPKGDLCVLGFAYYGDLQILGDVFLRHAYVYFDLSDHTVSLAQSSFSKKSKVVST